MWPMGLHDHFRPPLFPDWDWHGFHNGWASNIAAALNEELPPEYHAQPNVQFGIEIDVATIDRGEASSPDPNRVIAPNGGPAAWTVPAPTLTLSLPVLSDVVEVLVRGGLRGGPTVVGAIELVSPANKDRPSERDAFVTKCQAYVQHGIGVVIIDVVTERKANLHQALLARFLPRSRTMLTGDLYAGAYRPIERSGEPHLDVWEETLLLGRPLPEMPLWLPGDLCVRVDLNASYERTCREQRIPNAAP
jgi:hypothetical protein